MIEFRTLGTIDLRGDDGALIPEPLQHAKRIALLAYLAVSHPIRLQRRTTLTALLWPDLDESHGRGMLRHELYASVSMLVAMLYLLLERLGVNHDLTLLASFGFGLALRLAAIRWSWSLPVFSYQPGRWE